MHEERFHHAFLPCRVYIGYWDLGRHTGFVLLIAIKRSPWPFWSVFPGPVFCVADSPLFAEGNLVQTRSAEVLKFLCPINLSGARAGELFNAAKEELLINCR